MDSIVALDIETTGLDPEKDAIIEIGAVRFNRRRIENEWSSLINPGRRVPPFITQLTGITDQMVLQAPTISEVIPELAEFTGDSPVLGHNVRFDLAFLRRQKILRDNIALDTYELASVLLPTAARYNLGSLAQALGVLLPATHRALEDAQVTRGIYHRLYEEAMQLPIGLVAEIVRLSEPLEWGGYWVFRDVLRARSKEILSAQQMQHAYHGPLYDSLPGISGAPLQPKEELLPLDVDEIAAILEHGGQFSRHFPTYEYRPQQVEMLRAVTQALTESRHLMVEAGTGVGKSIGYLIPCAQWALLNDTRVVISTNTINLQDQLINKDIPDLCTTLGLELRAAVIKGRSNYLCPRRLEHLRKRGPETADEMRVLAKVLVWLQTTHTGDRAELNLNNQNEFDTWMHISAEDEACTTENCLKRTGGNCPFYRIHQMAQNAHILIVNHALLLADVATGNRVLPDYHYLVVDEAHHLEDATTNALSYDVKQADIDRLLRELGGPSSGLLGRLLFATKEVLPPSDYAGLTQLVQRATDHAFRLEALIKPFFAAIEQFLFELREGRPVGAYAQKERITHASRKQASWSSVEIAWEEAESALQPLIETIQKLLQTIGQFAELLTEEEEETYSNLSNLLRRFSELYDNLHALVFEPVAERIYWAETNADMGKLSLHAAPLHIGSLMQRYLWHEKASVILTSATLTAAGEFGYLRERLAAEDAHELSLGSPFDYENSTLLYLAKDIAEPSDRHNYQHGIENTLIHLCKATGGRTLALFTSYDQLKRTSQAIGPVLARDDIVVYEQGEGASPHSLLESFRYSERAVLLGTRAFWEGIDVPGEALSVLVITRLPFDVPSDPIVAARSETFEDPFYQYNLPEAILRFRQGFGRLIRAQTDRGVVAVLDRRIMSKPYGRLFLDSLPTCTVQVGAIADLPRAARRWLNL